MVAPLFIKTLMAKPNSNQNIWCFGPILMPYSQCQALLLNNECGGILFLINSHEDAKCVTYSIKCSVAKKCARQYCCEICVVLIVL